MKIIEVFKVYWSGSTLTPLKKNFIADMDELEHAKKRNSCENVNIE